MAYFPQLSSGATGQYPIQRRRIERTIINQLPDGHTVKFADAGAEQIEWRLTFQELTDSEIATLQQFFTACEGQLNGFTFLDPLNNLLAWSEAISQPAWEASTMLQLTPGIGDPTGGTNATRLVNPTGSTLSVQQSVSAPGELVYCFSAYVRSQNGVPISLFRQTVDASASQSYATQAMWSRISLSGSLSTAAGSIAVGITVAGGQAVDVYGFQLEPQPAASPYKSSYSASGVYSNAHFAQDAFTVTATGPNRNRCTLTISTR